VFFLWISNKSGAALSGAASGERFSHRRMGRVNQGKTQHFFHLVQSWNATRKDTHSELILNVRSCRTWRMCSFNIQSCLFHTYFYSNRRWCFLLYCIVHHVPAIQPTPKLKQCLSFNENSLNHSWQPLHFFSGAVLNEFQWIFTISGCCIWSKYGYFEVVYLPFDLFLLTSE